MKKQELDIQEQARIDATNKYHDIKANPLNCMDCGNKTTGARLLCEPCNTIKNESTCL